MKRFPLPTGCSALVIVAHPDDETIWSGGMILAHTEINWTILSLCRASDPDRAPKFQRVAKVLGAEAIITDLEDEGRLGLTASIKPIKKIIKEALSERSFDCVFTHGDNGEYGHPRHQSVHLAVRELIQAKQLNACELWCFHYKKISKYKLAPKAGADYLLKLTPILFKKKFALITNVYGFDPKGIDANYCTNPESYKKYI